MCEQKSTHTHRIQFNWKRFNFNINHTTAVNLEFSVRIRCCYSYRLRPLIFQDKLLNQFLSLLKVACIRYQKSNCFSHFFYTIHIWCRISCLQRNWVNNSFFSSIVCSFVRLYIFYKNINSIICYVETSFKKKRNRDSVESFRSRNFGFYKYWIYANNIIDEICCEMGNTKNVYKSWTLIAEYMKQYRKKAWYPLTLKNRYK